MPVGSRKNRLYGLALPVFGRRCRWKQVHAVGGEGPLALPIRHALRRSHAVGACVQVLRQGRLAERYCAGYANLAPERPVTEGTVFRTASIAKMACALLVMRLHTLGRLDVDADIAELWGAPIRNPNYPDVPIPLVSLLGHTSGMCDSQRYFDGFGNPVPARNLLADPATFTAHRPLETFRYSNFAAGLIGCLLEQRFQESLETLAQRELFGPLDARATFDLSTLGGVNVANCYRVLPPARKPDFDATARFRAASPLDAPDPQTHYLLASGGLFLTAEALGRLCLPLMNGGLVNGQPFLSPEAVARMAASTVAWPEPAVRMRHGLGLLEVDDPHILPRRLHGHQGFAYGAVNGVFFDDQGNGFASLNSGASEMRVGHLSCLNRDLIRACLPEEPYAG